MGCVTDRDSTPVKPESLHELQARERWLRWRVYAGDVALVTGFAAGLYVAFGVIGFSVWTVLGVVAGAALASKLYAGRAARVREAQSARRQLLMRKAYQTERPPVLALRSFLSPVTMPAAEMIRLFGQERPLNDEDSPAAPRSHVLTIASRIRKAAPVVAIGPPRSGAAASPGIDVLFFEPTDTEWFDVFEALSLGCAGIVLLPGETQGLLREIDSLRRRGLLGKLLLIMPPLRRNSARVPWVHVHDDDVVHGWREARRALSALNVTLPEYDPRGLAMALNEDGTVREGVPLERSFVGLGRAVRTLILGTPHPTARPLREIMRDLERRWPAMLGASLNERVDALPSESIPAPQPS